MSIEFVSSAKGVRVTATFPLTHRCPFRDELDEGTVTVSWTTVHHLSIELHSLARYLAEFRDVAISHEDLTVRVLDDLQGGAGGDRPLSVADIEVSTAWRTAGAEVVVTNAVPRERQFGTGA